MLDFQFICPLVNGIHARPATEIEQRAAKFEAQITIINQSKDSKANAKSVLSMIGADILLNDQCQFVFQGADEQQAYTFFKSFVENELADIDGPVETAAADTMQDLPLFLEKAQPQFLRGKAASSGIGRGKPVIIGKIDLHSVAEQYPAADSSENSKVINSAVLKTTAALEHEIEHADTDAKAVLDAHLAIIKDTQLQDTISKHIDAFNAPAVIALAGDEICQTLEGSSSSYLRERALDIRDIANRIVENIVGEKISSDLNLTQGSVLISEGLLTPSQLLALPKEMIKGLVMGDGGDTSHTVILARSFNIPTLTGVEQAVQLCSAAQEVIVDARAGVLIADANEMTNKYYQLEAVKQAKIEIRLAKFKSAAVSTSDQVELNISANIVTSNEILSSLEAGADGIGLFRTEMLFCERAVPPTEEEQFEHYKFVVENAAGKKAVIRTLDIGGDKPCEYMGLPEEENPFLGYRAIRMYPEYEDIIKTQFRALVRAGEFGEVSIMVPMISNLDEIKWIRNMLDVVTAEICADSNKTVKVSLGIMVEVPSTLYLLEKASSYIDFVSIGSNDLTQYFLACDRGNKNIANLYNHLDPSFLRLVRDIIANADQAGLRVSLCGEMASDPTAQPLLIGAGLRNFSMSASLIGKSKEQLCALNVSDCQALLAEAIDADNPAQVTALVEKFTAADQQMPIMCKSLIFTKQAVSSKEEAIKRLTDNLEAELRIPVAGNVEKAIWDREAVFSTALGFSVAIPHCKSEHVSQNSVSVMTLDKGIDWGNDTSIELVIMLTVSKDDSDDTHMKIFSKIARKLMHEDFRSSLIDSDNPESILHTLQETIAA
ncbi:phosphoenolpyruvate--protein phosphotransferase [Psychromonas aquimarina]|uniref:phosphoenolpyruvate--protein phosphotransferase n=1 Tax=Psychromonas aquimarina TaxID=444919 RepID=UPI00042A14CB|nr:phosphoenolpyruvate--protein phosphotransferase [Psychromonas aquimarina]